MPSPTRVAYTVFIVCLIVLVIFSVVQVSSSFGDAPTVNNFLIRVSRTLQSLQSQVDAQIDKTNHYGLLPPSHYQKDERGAIDVFEKNGYILCRIYVACRLQTSEILLPLWMRNHANILAEKCAMSNFRFVHYSRLQNFPESPAVFDWLAPNVPTPALRNFAVNPLSYFYATHNASRSKLNPSPSLRRICLTSKPSNNSNTSICNMHPEARVMQPLAILNVDSKEPATHSDFQDALREAFLDTFDTDLTILNPSSELLQRQRVCFRSVITSPAGDHLAGQTVPRSPAFISPAEQYTNVSETVDEALDEADRAIQFAEFDKDETDAHKPKPVAADSFVIPSKKAQNSSTLALQPNNQTETQGPPATHSPKIQKKRKGNGNNKKKQYAILENNSKTKSNPLKNETSSMVISKPKINKEDVITVKNLSISLHRKNSTEDHPMQASQNTTVFAKPSGIKEDPIKVGNISISVSPSNKTDVGYETDEDPNIARNYDSDLPAKKSSPVLLAVKNLTHAVVPDHESSVSRGKKFKERTEMTLNGIADETGKDSSMDELVEKPINQEAGEKENNALPEPSPGIENEALNTTFEITLNATTEEVKLDSTGDMEERNISTKVQNFDRMLPMTAHAATRAAVDRNLMQDGGIELFTHRTIDGISWNSTSPSNSNTYGVCRVYKACRNEDESLLLPQWMEKFKPQLERHCGMTHAKFIPNAEFNSMYGRMVNENSKKESGFGGMLKATGLKKKANEELELDLIGTRTYRAQEQHFVTDLFHEGMHAIDAVLSHRSKNESSTFSRECVYRSTGNEINDISQLECNNSMSYEAALRPAFIVTDTAKTRNAATKYIRGVIGMVPPRGRGGARLIFSSELSKKGKDEATCFRSILLTHNAYPPQSVLHADEHNVFYEHNRLSRESVTNKVEGKKQTGLFGMGQSGEGCHVRLAVLKPSKKAISKDEPLGIENEEEILQTASRLTKVLGIEEGLKGTELMIKKYRHGGGNVGQASRVIQESEMVLSGNDPSLTNIMFARPHTAVIEIQPFGYSSGPYRNFARSLNLTYRNVMAKPDMMSFEKCVQERHLKDWPAGVTKGEMEARMNGLLRLFREASEEFKGSDSSLDLTTTKLSDGSTRGGYIPRERVCARAQRLRVNADEVGRLLAKEALKICQLQKEVSSKLKEDA